jgi:hypothetical protein
MGIGDGMYTINAKAVKFAIDNTPTADVVPKSVVEELKKDRYQILPDGRLELLPRTDIDAIKAEVAREIFEKIEEARERWEAIYSSDHFGFDGGAYRYLETDVDHTIYELKKKYTEEKKDGNEN